MCYDNQVLVAILHCGNTVKLREVPKASITSYPPETKGNTEGNDRG